MNPEPVVRALLMTADFTSGSAGFHRMVFKVDEGRGRSFSNVTVLISVDAFRKLTAQLSRARLPRVERDRLLMLWARWEISIRLRDFRSLPSTLTVTASDIDDFGAYANDLGRTLIAAS